MSLNILICKAYRDLDTSPRVKVCVRWKYSPLDEDGSCVMILGRDVWRNDAKRKSGEFGAFCNTVYQTELDDAIALLREKYGNIHVQNNLPPDMIEANP